MKKIILIYGLIAGAIVTGMFLISLPLQYAGYFDLNTGMVVGYTSMVVAFSMIFFAIRNYRDNLNNGSITFGEGFRIGILITVIASLVYATTWEVYYAFNGDAFTEHYINCMLDAQRADGVTGAALDAERVKLEKDFEMYQHFFIRFGMTLFEIFPVGLLITLFTAAILRRRAVSPA
jgi:hypothetical protein